jgi:chemotaxis protein methyltransferase WspC
MTPDIEALLRRTMGLTAESIGSQAIERAVRDRMNDRGVLEVDAYWHLLNTSADELTDLIETVVVPETWFFRYPEAFAALTHVVQTAWLVAHPGGTLRVLSAPCSTGEEAYSIAITLLEAGLSPERFRVDAVDISQKSLAFARRAIYGGNSFRGNDANVRERYCEPVGRGYQLIERVRRLVHFHQRNLVSDHFIPPQPPYDVVFCRNLLIYLDPPTQAAVLSALQRAMTAEGYLFVGPAEVPAALERGFRPLGIPMAFAHQNGPARYAPAQTAPRVTRRSADATSGPRRSVSPRIAPASKDHLREKHRPGMARGRADNTRQTSSHDSGSEVAASLAAAQRLADSGKLVEAITACERLVREQGASADAYYLLGVVHDALHDRVRAEASYRKTLFLAPDHAEAALHLAALLRGRGDDAGARRFEARVRRTGGRA